MRKSILTSLIFLLVGQIVHAQCTINAVTSRTHCIGAPGSEINFAGVAGNADYTWTSSVDVGFGLSGTGNIAAYTAANATSSAVTATITVQATTNAGSCTSPIPDMVFTITVHPKPVVSLVGTVTPVCSGSPSNIGFTSTGSNPTYSWTVQTATAGVTAPNASGTTNPFAEVLSNSASSAGNLTIEVKSSVGGCESDAVSVMIPVKPRPTITADAASISSICSGAATSLVWNSNMSTGNTFNWTVTSPSQVTGASNGMNVSATGTSTTIAQTLQNTSNSTSYSVTYDATVTNDGCTSTSVSASVQVKPRPVVSVNPAAISICSGAPSSAVLSSSVSSGTNTFAWSVSANPNSITASATSGSSSAINPTLTNPSNAVANIITFSATVENGGCTSPAVSVPVTVRPKPVAGSAAIAAICSGTAPTVNLTSTVASGSTFAWSPVAPVMSGAAAGSGPVIAQALTSADNAATVNQAYSVTVTADNCTSDPLSIQVPVKPKPVATHTFGSGTSGTICSGTAPQVQLASTAANPTYSWTVAGGTVITGGSNGTGSTIDQTLTNPSSALPNSITYHVTTTSDNCASDAYPITVAVNPRPVVTNVAKTICSGTEVAMNLTASTPASGNTFAWTLGANPGNITGASAGSGAMINHTLVNPSQTNQAALTYLVTATSNNCVSAPLSLAVSVSPRPAAPVILTLPNPGPCLATRNFNVRAFSPTPGVDFTWSIVNGNGKLMNARSQNGISNAVISVDGPGTSMSVKVRNSFGAAPGSCGDSTTVVIPINAGPAADSAAVIHNGRDFVVLARDVDAYQWGYDSVGTLGSFSLPNETFQNYSLANPNTGSFHYWVMVRKGSCWTKMYYNKPYGRSVAPTAPAPGISVDLRLQPNPVKTDLLVSWDPARYHQRIQLVVTDGMGRRVLVRELDNGAANGLYSLPVSRLSSGLYFVSIVQQGRSITTARFVKE